MLLLNEIGLDPGVDHCSALALLESLRREGKKVASFTSFCGGLPAPECADVPLKYKFSWSPRGVLSAALNSAQFLIGGKVSQMKWILAWNGAERASRLCLYLARTCFVQAFLDCLYRKSYSSRVFQIATVSLIPRPTICRNLMVCRLSSEEQLGPFSFANVRCVVSEPEIDTLASASFSHISSN